MHSTEIIRGIFGPSLTPVLSSHPCSHSRHSGRLYLTSNAICFYSNLFGFEKKICLVLSNVVRLSLLRSTSIQILYVEQGGNTSRNTGNDNNTSNSNSNSNSSLFKNFDSKETLNSTIEQENDHDTMREFSSHIMVQQQEQPLGSSGCGGQQEVEYIFRSFENREAVLGILKQLHNAAIHGSIHHVPPPTTTATAATTTTRMSSSYNSLTRSSRKPRTSARSMTRKSKSSHNNNRSQSVPPQPDERHGEPLPHPNRTRGYSSPDWKEDGVFQESSGVNIPPPLVQHHGEEEEDLLSSISRAPITVIPLRQRLHSTDTAASSTSTSSLLTVSRGVPEVFNLVKSSPAAAAALEDWKAVKQEYSTSYSQLAISTQTFPLLSLDTFHQTFLSNDAPHSISTFQQQHMGDTQVTCTHWKTVEGDNNGCCEPIMEERNLNSLHPRSAKLGPSIVPTFKVQSCTKYGTVGMRIKTDTTVEKVPYCDCFVVQDEWLLENTASTRVGGKGEEGKYDMQLTVRFRVKFVKSTMFKKVIANQTKEEVCKWYRSYLEMVQSVLRFDGQEGQHENTLEPSNVPHLPEHETEFHVNHLKWNPQFMIEYLCTTYSSTITFIDGWSRPYIRYVLEYMEKGTFGLVPHVLIIILTWKLLDVNLRLYQLEHEVVDMQREQLKILGDILKAMSSIQQNQ